MSGKKQRLELTWVGKDEAPKLEPRILIGDPTKSYGDKSENMLIKGDNLLALKALEQEYAGRVKCVYIDPPYNTGNAFEHYDDGLEHSIWLSLIKPRLELLRNLLSNDGSLWISIDDDESHYLKVLCDEVFGRQNFMANVVWQKKHTRSNDAKWFSDNHDHVLVYAKDKTKWVLNKLPRTQEQDKGFTNPDNDPRGPWSSQPLQVKTPSEAYIYEIVTPAGKRVWPPKGRSWMFGKARYEELVIDNRIWFGKDGMNVPRMKKFLSEVQDGIVPLTIWYRDEVGDNQEAKKEMKELFPDEPFGTPKPERLIERVLTLASREGDLVLDSFLGSGTTAAVAHKMGRRWIGIEMGEHCDTHCLPRLKAVADGSDTGGISKSVGWSGGGGFAYYSLAPSLIRIDEFGQAVIDERYNADMLAAAMARHEGFVYLPDVKLYWKQGVANDTDYIYTTTGHITHSMLDTLAEGLKDNESLVICAKSFDDGCKGRSKKITLKKIPQAVMDKCEYKPDGYPLNIVNPPIFEDEEEASE